MFTPVKIVFDSSYRICSCSMTLKLKENAQFSLPIEIINGTQFYVRLPNEKLVRLENVGRLNDELYFWWIHHPKDIPFEPIN